MRDPFSVRRMLVLVSSKIVEWWGGSKVASGVSSSFRQVKDAYVSMEQWGIARD